MICSMNLQACVCDIQDIVFVYSFVVYLMALFITQILEGQIVGS